MDACRTGQYSIRSAKLSDLEAICALENTVFSRYGTNEDPGVIASRLQVFAVGFLVAEDVTHHQLAGYCSSERSDNEHPPLLNSDPVTTHTADGSVLCVTSLAVRPDLQGAGLGTRLLSALRNVAAELQCRTMVLSTSNASSFYLHRGFTIAGIHEDHGVPLFFMSCVVDDID